MGKPDHTPSKEDHSCCISKRGGHEKTCPRNPTKQDNFTVVQDSNTVANETNTDLKLTRQWAHDWKMLFNPDLQKQQITFSKEKIS